MICIRVSLLALGLALLSIGPLPAQEVPAHGEWRSYAGDVRGTKYGPLGEITGENFVDLEMVWSWRSADALLPAVAETGVTLVEAETLFDRLQATDPDRWVLRPSIGRLSATPLMVDGVLYLSTPLYQAAAIDARTGLCAVATLVLPWFLVLPGTAAGTASGELLVYGGIAVGILGVLATIHAWWTRLPRFIRRTQGEAIKGALGSYHPSPAELDLVLAGLRAAGTALGKRTDREWLTALFYSPAALSAEPIA